MENQFHLAQGERKWKLKELARNLPARDRRIGSPELCASIRYSRRPTLRLFKARA
jgi:hypothetical protein